MGVYGGKTWEGSYFNIDKVYNNYKTMLADISNIFVGRYVLVMYSDEAYPQDVRTTIESYYGVSDPTGVLSDDELKYYNNFAIDKDQYGNSFNSADRKVFRAIYNGNKIIPQEIASLNTSITNSYIEDIAYYWKEFNSNEKVDRLSFLKGSEEELPENLIPGGLYITTDKGNIYLDTEEGRIQLSTNVQNFNERLEDIRDEFQNYIDEYYANNLQIIISEEEPTQTDMIWFKPSDEVVDYVVSQGIENNWYYTKWYSGKCEVYQKFEFELSAATETEYHSWVIDNSEIDYPFVFTEIWKQEATLNNIKLITGANNYSRWYINWYFQTADSEAIIPNIELGEIRRYDSSSSSGTVSYTISAIGTIS